MSSFTLHMYTVMYMKCLATNFKKPSVRFSGSAFNSKASSLSLFFFGERMPMDWSQLWKLVSYFANPEKMKK